MTTSGISSIIPDAAASGSQAVKLWNNGDSVSAKAIFPTSAWYAFAFAGRQDYYGGTNAHISLYTEKSGTSAGDTYVSSTSNYQTYTIDAWLSAGWHSFKLVFDNDAWGGTPILDRNVYIDTVSVAMTTIPPYTILGRAYYIDCNGADTNVGTSAHSAWQSLSKASSVELNPGDTLLFKRSCIWWGALTLNSSGTSSAPIIVGAYGSGSLPLLQTNLDGDTIVDVKGSHITVDSLAVQAFAPSIEPGCQNNPKGEIAGFGLETGAHDDTISNSTARGGSAGINVGDGAYGNHIMHNTLSNNNMMSTLTVGGNDDSGAFGILLHGDSNDVSYNTITGSTACSYDYKTDGAAVEVYGGRRNTIHHNMASRDQAFTELGNDRSSDNTYAYNLYTSDLPGSLFLTTRGASDSFGPVKGTKAYNNTVYETGSGSQGFSCGGGCSGNILTMRNNVIAVNGTVGYADHPFDEDYDLFYGGPTRFTRGAHTLVANPLFVSAGANFHLQVGSPALNAGTDLGYTSDLEGALIPATHPSMGTCQGVVGVC